MAKAKPPIPKQVISNNVLGITHSVTVTKSVTEPNKKLYKVYQVPGYHRLEQLLNSLPPHEIVSILMSSTNDVITVVRLLPNVP